ncbi:MAG TPA: hypothetical protein VIV66_08925, partial [Pyrinomonadaceae bacterium]
MTDYRELIHTLASSGIEFIIIGGAAATAHGATRLTDDLDVVYNRDQPNLAKIVNALAPLQPYPRDAPARLPFKWEEATLSHGLNFRLRTSVGPLDLFGEIIAGGTYQDLLPHAIMLTIFGQQCRCLNARRLIEIKRATGRLKDQEV